jgi:hypothetical protein
MVESRHVRVRGINSTIPSWLNPAPDPSAPSVKGFLKTITKQIARSVLNQKLKTETHNQRWPQAVRSFSEFVETEWRPTAPADSRNGFSAVAMLV